MLPKRHPGQCLRFAGGQKGWLSSGRIDSTASRPTLPRLPRRPSVHRPDPTGPKCVRVLDSTSFFLFVLPGNRPGRLSSVPWISKTRGSALGAPLCSACFRCLGFRRREVLPWAPRSAPPPSHAQPFPPRPASLVGCPGFGFDKFHNKAFFVNKQKIYPSIYIYIYIYEYTYIYIYDYII